MLSRQKVIIALEEKRNQFEDFAADLRRQQASVQEKLEAFARRDCHSVQNQLDEMEIAWPGALPTDELDQTDTLCLPFTPKWQNHQEARAWALSILRDRPVVAVDGSQITPTKDISVPVGAVQIGWYINYHRAGGHYIKDLDFDVLAPTELSIDPEDESGDGAYDFPNWRVNQERFVRECEKLCQIMADFAETSDAAKPLCFFDGSFIVSFAGQMRPARGRAYVRAVEHLLDCSTRYRIPLIGYIDTSYSRDFVTMLELLTGTPGSLSLGDAALLRRSVRNWGDRSPFFLCARDDGLTREGRADFYTDVAFAYLRVASDRAPVRIEMPRWQLEEGLAEDLVNLVRAECVVGTGYPYAIETADALAVINQQDRLRFYALFEQFAQKAGMELTQARKAASKQARR